MKVYIVTGYDRYYRSRSAGTRRKTMISEDGQSSDQSASRCYPILRSVLVWFVALLGLSDFVVQQITSGKVRIIKTILDAVFG